MAGLAQDLAVAGTGRLVVLEGNAAERTQMVRALADQLGYRLELQSVSSKFIGETEKNLASVLAKANHSAVVLFFDEADALFGSRTDVVSSHDRYAGEDFFRRLTVFRGLVVLGVERKSRLPAHFLLSGRSISVRDYWPPR